MKSNTQAFSRVAVALAIVCLLEGTSLIAQVLTQSGTVEGTASKDGKILIYKGIPYAAPPVGELRWKEPQPAPKWEGVRKATEFGARCMQGRIYEDMVFRDAGPSEDCLYLNVWTPKVSGDAKLPVMVWIYGGGFQAGATSEPRQDGERLAHKGVIVVSMNYRLGIFGFFSHPELDRGIPASRFRKLWLAGPGRRAEMGARKHRGVRRRSEQGNNFWRVRWIVLGKRVDGLDRFQKTMCKRRSEKAELSSEKR